MKPEPGEVTSPPHSSSKKEDGLKRERECQDMNDSDEEDDEDEDADMLEEEEVSLHPAKQFFYTNCKCWQPHVSWILVAAHITAKRVSQVLMSNSLQEGMISCCKGKLLNF